MVLPASRLANVGNQRVGPTSIFEVDVDVFDVTRMMDYAILATSGARLVQFMEEDVVEHFHTETMLRFVHEGDRKSGNWQPLADATQDIRIALGYGGDSPINERTGDLKDFVTTEYSILFGEDWAEVTIPGDTDNPLTAKKLQTAQQGSSDNHLGYGSTPPRPVLAADDTDLEELLVRLEGHVAMSIAGMLV
jgi:hypothetical protein